jgi:hypothetical protein
MFDIASLLAAAFRPPTGAAAPGMYAAQGSNSQWLMPGRMEAMGGAPPAASATPAIQALPVARPAQAAIDAAQPQQAMVYDPVSGRMIPRFSMASADVPTPPPRPQQQAGQLGVRYIG